MHRLWAIGLVALPPLLGGCAWFRGPPDPPRAVNAPLPPVVAPYRVQVGDVLGIRLYMTPELNEDVEVRPDGAITTTLAEAVPAAGRTPEAVAADLRGRYATELRDPRLTVEIRNFAPTRIYVAGEVSAPGEFGAVGPPPTLVQAVARAGGVRVTGDTSRIFIVRRGTDDHPIVLATDYAGAASGRRPEADIRLAPFDIVYVPKTGVARVYAWFNQHVQEFVPVSWGFSYNVNPVVNNTR